MFGGFTLGANPNQKLRTRKTESLAALLALKPGHPYLRETLAALFWPDDAPESARQSLRMALSNLRTALGTDAVRADKLRVSLDPDRLTSDVAEFESLLKHAKSNPETTVQNLEQAFALVTGPFLPGFESDWVTAETYRLHELLAEAALIFAELKTNEPNDAVPVLKRILALVGCREDLHIALMRLYVAAGLPSLAVAQFETLERELDDLWGEQPSEAALVVLDSAPRSARTQTQPPKSGRLIGRDQEIAYLTQTILHTTPCVLTLVGPGGSGKTALAQEVALNLTDQNLPAVFIDLTSAYSASAALALVLDTLKIPAAEARESAPALARHLEKNPSVLVLDNLEQLQDSARLLVQDILQAAPRAKLLLTSRIPVGDAAETLHHVRPLALPDPKSTLEEIRASDAVRLFVHHASQANPNFRLSTQNASVVVQLCRRLDGLPLALKLAAARISARTPAQILADLQLSVSVLSEPRAEATNRHASLASTVDWSLRLLNPDDRRNALRLSLLSGHFDLPLAAAILDQSDPCQSLEVLVRANLLNSDPNLDETQYWMYETVRDALQAALRTEPDQNDAWNQLLIAVEDRFRQVESNPEIPAWKKLQAHLTQAENTLAALEHAAQSLNTTPKAVNLAAEFQKVASFYGYVDRLTPLLESFYHSPPDNLPPQIRAKVGLALVDCLANRADSKLQEQILLECDRLAQDDLDSKIRASLDLGSHYKSFADYEKATERLDFVLANARPDDHESRSYALYLKSLVACCVNDRVGACEWIVQAIPEAKKAENLDRLVRVLFDAGAALANQKRHDEAIVCFEEAVVLCRKIGSVKLEGLTKWQRGDALLSMGRPQEALASLLESVDLVYEARYDLAQKWIYIKAAEAAVTLGLVEPALRLAGKGTETRVSENRPLADYEQDELDQIINPLKEKLGPTQYNRLWFEGVNADWRDLWQDLKIQSTDACDAPVTQPH